MIQLNLDQVSGGSATPQAGGSDPTNADRTELVTLVVRAQAGDLAAQSELVRRYLRRITGHVRSILRHSDSIDDVAQTVFIKMVRRLGRLRDPALFECWLFTLSRNTCVDHIRRVRRRPVATASEEELLAIPDAGSQGVTGEIMDELEAALAHLSPVDRKLVELYVQGNTYRAMASRNRLTPGAVKARLHRVRPYLRECLGGREAQVRPDSDWSSVRPRRRAA